MIGDAKFEFTLRDESYRTRSGHLYVLVTMIIQKKVILRNNTAFGRKESCHVFIGFFFVFDDGISLVVVASASCEIVSFF
jgi:phosphomannomutase